MDIMEKLLASQKQFKTVSRNQQVEGEVISKNSREITLDLGTKSEGIISVREIPQQKLDTLKVGDKLKAYVLMAENEHGQTVLSSTLQIKSSSNQRGSKGIDWQRFSQAQAQKSKLTGKVLEINKGGLIVEVEGSRGFLPNSQVGFELLSKAKKGLEDLKGESLTITVIEVDAKTNKLIFSQRGQVPEELLTQLKKFEKDQKVSGAIVAILPFGLVVDVSGMEGLVFISDVSWEKVEDISKLYKPSLKTSSESELSDSVYRVGDVIEVLITGLDEDLGRLNLSMKHLTEDPFSRASQKYKGDDVIKGEVVSVSDAGVVIKLEDPPGDTSGTGGVEGLLPSAKMDQTISYEVGKSVTVLIDNVDVKRRKITLAPMVTSTSGLIYK